MNREQIDAAAPRCPIKCPGLCSLRRLRVWRFVTLGLMGLFCPVETVRGEADEFAGTNLLAEANFLQTGGGSPLVRSNLSWSAPGNFTRPALVFAVGFASQEGIAPGEFFDSLTVTLRDSSNSFVAPVVTLDVLGTVFAPDNPGGVNLATTAIEPEALGYPPSPGVFVSQQAWLVMVVLPSRMTGQAGTLRLSLFDNQDTESSIGFISHLRVVPGPGTALAVESSTTADGPFAREGIAVRHARRSIMMPLPGAHRFFRLEASVPTSITGLESDDGAWVFRYSGGLPGEAPRLLSSAQIAGPYSPEGGIAANLVNRTLRRPAIGQMRMFRLNAEMPLTIQSITIEGDTLVLRYE